MLNIVQLDPLTGSSKDRFRNWRKSAYTHVGVVNRSTAPSLVLQGEGMERQVFRSMCESLLERAAIYRRGVNCSRRPPHQPLDRTGPTAARDLGNRPYVPPVVMHPSAEARNRG